MKCPRCGNMVNLSVAQCPHCGQPLRPAAPIATTVASATLATGALQNDFDRQKRRNLTIALISGAVALLACILFGMRASGALGANGESPKNKLLTASGAVPGPVLVAKGNTGPGVLAKTEDRPVDSPMPQDVYDWLKHLEKCEARKIEITGEQETELVLVMEKMQALGAGMGMMDPYDQSEDGGKDQDPGSFAAGKMKDLRPEWEELITYFRSKTPPEECLPIANDFDRAINEIPGETGDITEILNNVMSDPQNSLAKIEKMKSHSYENIDRYFIRADEGVQNICQKYHVTKWFNIKADVEPGSLGKFGTGLNKD